MKEGGGLGLRERLETERREHAEKSEKEAASLREKLLHEEKEKRLTDVRTRIIGLEARREDFEKVVASLETNYGEAGDSIDLYKKGKAEVGAKAKDFESAKDVLEKLRADFPEAFESKGITSAEQLAESSEFADGSEVVEYKRKKEALAESEGKRKSFGQSLRSKVSSVREVKRKVKEIAPDEIEVSFRAADRAQTLAQLKEYIAGLGTEIEILKRETPEGQQEKRQQLKSEFDARFKDRKFLPERSLGAVLVLSKDINAGRDWGAALVLEELHAAIGRKLDTEFEAEKEKAGVASLAREVEKLDRFSENVTQLWTKFREVNQKRHDFERFLLEYVESEEGKKIFEPVFGYSNTSPRDFVLQWTNQIENSAYSSSIAIRNLPKPKSSGGLGNFGGSPVLTYLDTVLRNCSDFSEKINYGNRSEIPLEAHFDPASCEAFIGDCNEMLDKCTDFVKANEKNPFRLLDLFRHYGNGHDRMYTREVYLNWKKNQPNPIPSPKLGERLRVAISEGKTLNHIKRDLKEEEEPYNKKEEWRKAALDALVDKEWSEIELNIFVREHSGIEEMAKHAETLKAERPVAERILRLVAQLRQHIDTFAADSAVLLKDFSIHIRDGAVSLPRYDKLSSFEERRSSLEKELVRIKADSEAHGKVGRPRFIGTGKYDKMQTELEERLERTNQEIAAADLNIRAIHSLQGSLKNSFAPLAQAANVGRFASLPSYSPEQWLSSLERLANNVASDSVPTDQESLIAEYAVLRESFNSKKETAKRFGV